MFPPPSVALQLRSATATGPPRAGGQAQQSAGAELVVTPPGVLPLPAPTLERSPALGPAGDRKLPGWG